MPVHELKFTKHVALKGEITIVLKQVVENLVAAETLELSATKT
jgi:hypothetical protein